MRTAPQGFGSSGHRAQPQALKPGAEQQFKEGLQRVNIPGWIIDDRGLFKWVNDAFIELFGDRVGQHYSSAVAPEHRSAVDLQFARKLAGTPVTDYEIDAVASDGRRVAIDVSSVRLDGSTFCGAVFGMAIVSKLAAAAPGSTHLTPRQLEILGLLAGGASTNQIAAELFISRETVRNHIRGILRALGAHARLEAVVKARSLGLLDD
jgi:PAS domain S-box-containing protein